MAEQKRLKVLRVVIGLNQGGVQQAVLNLFKGLNPQRFEPIACAIENTGAIGKEIEAAGFEVVVLGYKRQPFKTIRTLARLMREQRIDIVHASSYHPSFYARIAGVLARVPVLISHEHTVFDRRRWQRILFNRLLLPWTDAYICVAQGVARQVRDWFGYPRDRVHVIYNGVDTDRFRPPASKHEAKREAGLDPKRPVVGMVSRLDLLKGFDVFFEAIADLSRDHDVQWVVAGSGREEQQVRDLAQRMGVLDKLRFLGLRRDVPQLLASYDIYVLPTLKEGLSNSILEAMAAGCPVVVSDYPNNLEVVTDKVNGFVIPMKNGPALAACIRQLLADPALRTAIGKAARAHVEDNFSVQRCVAQTAQLYESLWAAKEAPQ